MRRRHEIKDQIFKLCLSRFRDDSVEVASFPRGTQYQIAGFAGLHKGTVEESQPFVPHIFLFCPQSSKKNTSTSFIFSPLHCAIYLRGTNHLSYLALTINRTC